MLFPTVTFAIFFAVVLPLSWILMPHGTRWKVFILFASFVFLAYPSPMIFGFIPLFVALLVASSVGNWVLGSMIHAAQSPRARRVILTITIAANLGLLGYYKYFNFFASQVRGVLSSVGIDTGIETLSIVLPIAISFFTFQCMSYVIDIYRKDLEPVKLLEFLVYIAFFPHLIAGPIVRASEFVPQLRVRHDPRRIDATRGFALIVGGLIKKLVIADFLGRAIVKEVFPNPEQHNALELITAVYAYAVQIYCDFSGYTDIAIGLALLLGFKFPQNFDRPYMSENIQDFWRRWHMTLSRWLRDYLYIPLGGNRRAFVPWKGWVSTAPTTTTVEADGVAVTTKTEEHTSTKWFVYGNLMIVMLLGGLWHGAGWSFAVWGGIHGTALIVHHVRADRRRAAGKTLPDTMAHRAMRRFLTFQIVCFAWIFFPTRMGDTVAPTFSDSLTIIWRMLTAWGGPAPLVKVSVLLAIAAGIGMQYLPRDLGKRALARASRLAPAAQAAVLGVTLLIISVLAGGALEGRVPDFIYFAF